MNCSKKKKISTYAPKLRSFQPGAGEEEISGGKILAMDVTGTSPRQLQLKFGKFGKFDRKDKLRDNLGLLDGVLPAPKKDLLGLDFPEQKLKVEKGLGDEKAVGGGVIGGACGTVQPAGKPDCRTDMHTACPSQGGGKQGGLES